MNEGTMECASAERAGKGEPEAMPEGQAWDSGVTAPQAKAARARMLGGEPFCALRGAQRKMVRRADWSRCKEDERGGAEPY